MTRAVTSFLVASPHREAAQLAPAVRAVVVGLEVAPLAAALALNLRVADGAPAAVVATWNGEPKRATASRAAARLATRLTNHALPAVPRGRLAWLALPPDAPEAAAAVRRASLLVEGPLVTALEGARPAPLDDLVSEHDLVVVAVDPSTALARAALARFAERGVAAVACSPLARGPARALALAGLTAPRLDDALRDA
jgi:hypothetical protein